MSINEGYPSNSGETNSAESSDNNGWSNFPPSNGGEKPAEDTSEISKTDKSESEEYFDIDGVEYRDISKIDITSNQGKFEWLDSLVENCKTRVDDEYDGIIREEGLYGMDKKEQEEWLEYNDAYQDNRREYDLAKRQSKILENLDIDGEGGVLGALERRRNAFAETMNNPKASSKAQEAAFKNWDATANLYFILAGEMARRDPEYFGYGEMEATLNSEVKDAEKRVESTMVDGYFGEDGFLHKAPNGEKMPSAATEDAKIDLKYAKQDAETFGLLMGEYQAANDYNVSRAIKKEDFAPTIDRFIENHTSRINQLMAESKTLAKGTPEYAENQAKRRELASERSSARRLSARYFNVPKVEAPTSKSPETSTDDDGMSMEQMPAGKIEEQAEVETNEHQQEKSPTTYHFEGGLVDKDVTIMVGQEIPDEWLESRNYEDGTDGGFGIKISRPPLIDDYLSQALNTEFGKLSQDERKLYDYAALSKAINAEAKRTKRVPDIANILNRQRAINEQRGKVEQSYDHAPDYLTAIDPARRKEIIDTSAEMTRDIPGAVICGGNANRILYEAYTGKTMFGVGKNDSDIYVPHENMERFLTEQPEGYELKHELDESGQEKWIHPETDYIVLNHSGEHIDVFGTGDSHESTMVELDGQAIRVQSLTDQINDKVRMMYETEGLTKIAVDPVHNPDPISKYGVYAQRILEMADSEKGKAELAEHADELPEDWRETMEAMASQGKYGDQLDPEKRDAFQEKMEAWKKIQELMKQIQDQMMNDLRAYFEENHNKSLEERSGTLPSLVSGLEDKVNESLNEASSADDFIQKIIGKMSDDEKKEIKSRIKNIAGGE